ncbi:Rap1a/Tai family immunity protein [Pseudomonas fluorescens]|uniref:Rap1a/Tai family immunity protein n=1 Tax=Pseudomonas fluorescens TaxID=294 RepID=UPI0012420F32|nr:Rap1a/Tai family immunity protein [Pseudomonas fluorescens]
MKAGIAVAAALVGMLGSGAAMAENGTRLLEQCQDGIRALDNENMTSDGLFASGFCFGLIEGVRFTMENYQFTNIPNEYKACFPKGHISNAQGARIVVKYLKDNPETLHEDAAILTTLALHNAFPCK